MGKDLTTLISNLRTDLSDIAESEWTATELERAVERALADYSRFCPRELTYDIVLSADNILNNVSIELAGYIDEVDGMVGFIRVDRVEYPANLSPQIFCQFELFGTLLTITGAGESDSQSTLAVGQTLRIYYHAPHTMPDDDIPGSCPAFMDNTVLLAASAYALFQRAINYICQANTDFAATRTSLVAAAAALDKVATYLEDNSNEDSKGWLTKITTDIDDLRTAVLAALNGASGYLGSVAGDLTAADEADTYLASYVTGATAPGVAKYLGDGDAFLNAIADGGEGQDVPHAYRQYAQTTRDALVAPLERNREFLAGNATARTNAAMIYVQEAAQRLSNLRSYIEQADAWGSIATRFINEAEQRFNDAYQYNIIATNNMTLADKFKEEATVRRDEAWSIWRDRKQYIGDFSASSVRQMAK
jgi:hypothetical protein